MTLRRSLTILLFWLTFFVDASPVKFYSINSLFGISMRVTNSICKDNNGFIWASSKTGILRLTDNDYHIYQLPYKTAGAITVNLVYEKPKLIAYTNNGQVFSYNPVYDRFDLILNLGDTLNASNDFNVFGLLVDFKNEYWMATNKGLYRYHQGKLSLYKKNSDERFSIAWYDKQNLIIAEDKGIWLLDIETLKSRQVCEIKNTRPFLVSSMYFDRASSKLWMGTLSNGLFLYNFRSNSYARILQPRLPKQPILAIEESPDSSLLIGIDGQGIWKINENANQVLNVYKENSDDPYSLRGNGVYAIFHDKEKRRIWIGTISGGVSYYDIGTQLVSQLVHRVNDKNSLVNNDVNGILEDSDGKIWFATNNGISCWNETSNKWSNYYYNKLEQAQVFLTLCEDDEGRIWAGSYSSGVYVLDRKTGHELAHYSPDIPGSPAVSNFIMNIYKDGQGDLWIGGVSGKYICYLSKENKFKTYTEEPISSFGELSPTQILLGFSYGMSLLNKQTGEIKNLLSGLPVQEILVIGENVWICTSGDGLVEYNFKTGERKTFTTQSGLPSNFINSLAYTNNYLWVGTEGGLCRFDPRDGNVLTFSSIFPLSGLSYNKSSVCKLKNGQLAWGTNNGAVIFDPNKITEQPSKGKIYFNDLTVSGRSIREIPSMNLITPVDSLRTINLKYFQNTISLELLSIGAVSGVKFSWELDGFDESWSRPTDNRIITYTNLPSGKYSLKVRLFDSSTSKVLDERSVVIHLIPPFWRRGWFMILLFIVISGIAILYLLLYINRLKQKHTEEKVRFFTNTAHDIRTSLTLIKAPVEELSRETNLSAPGRRYLQLATDQARQLSSVVNQLIDFQKVDVGKEKMLFRNIDIVQFILARKLMYDPLAKTRNIQLLFTSDRESYLTAVDELKIEKVIDNLISNAVKYSHPDSEVLIDLKCYPEKWVFQVKDQGIGISKRAQRRLFREFYRSDNAVNSKVVGSGIGLLLVKKYVSLHHGNVSCESQENVGTTFKVAIPYKVLTTGDNELVPVVEANEKSYLLPDEVQPYPMQQSAKMPRELKVLVVEDNEELLEFLNSTLSVDFKVYTAEDGVEAWAFITKQMPDLVISDIMMPNMNGYKLCKLMKSTFETSHIPIILLTALSEKDKQLHGLGLGADDYLTKPFDINLLIQRIKTIIRNREVVREKALKLIKSDSTEPILANDLNDKFIKRISEVARANISNSQFNKELFASEMNMSPSLLYKKIKLLTDQSPTDFIKIVRLDKALELLKTRNYTVTEVSELSGFSSVAYFSTVFKKHYGKSPTEIFD